MRHLFFLFPALFFTLASTAQSTDSLLPVKSDSNTVTQVFPDTISGKTIKLQNDSLDSIDSLQAGPDSLPFQSGVLPAVSEKESKKSEPVQEKGTLKKFNAQELLFYTLAGLLIFYALMKIVFAKYFSDLFRVYFRTTLKQSQMREQLLQTPLPSLLLNLFFILTGGMYSAFLIRHFKIAEQFNFWQLWLYAGILLSIIYMMKFTGVKMAGWLFNRNDAAAGYVFIVFMTNKIIGIVVLPFLVLLAFGHQKIYPAALILSVVLVASFFIYRLYLTMGMVRSQMRVNPFQFLLYFAAFEIVPLLILFKLVVIFLN